MLTTLYMAIIGLLYLFLAGYCIFAPEKAAGVVNLQPQGAGGKSEFLTVYGGLEVGMALIFLLPLYYKSHLLSAFYACLIIHVCLVTFRTISFFMAPAAIQETISIAIGEWVILLVGIAILVSQKSTGV